MDTYENLIVVRNILYKCFFIGLFFLFVAAILYLPCKCYVSNLYQTTFGISASAYYNLWAGFVGLIKTILIFIFLVPALATHSVAHGYAKKHKSAA